MADASLTPRKLALAVGVSQKTVERWVTDEDLIPHPQNRDDASRALGVDEAMLWPKAVRERLKTGGDRELVRSYPYRSAAPTSLWADLIARASRDVLFAGYTNYFVWTQQPAFPAVLRARVAAGVRVRFLLGDPDGEVTRQREEIEDVPLTVSTRIRMTLSELGKLGPLEGLETRYSAPLDAANHVSLSVFRFGTDMLVTPHLARLVGHDSPLLHLRRHDDGGMFDRFAEHAEELWDRGRAV
jgi:transcriptional regulator with XRE-family HTH domain